VLEIRKTDTYVQWLDSLRDIKARARVLARVERLASGNPGDVKPVGESISEIRIDYGPGCRVYYDARTNIDNSIGRWRKRSQAADIKTALRLARNL
jgi:putative addiction module killer protein